MIALGPSFLAASCRSAQGSTDSALPGGPLAGWLYRRAAARPSWHHCWIWQHQCKGLHPPPGKAGPYSQGRGCLTLFSEPATSSSTQPEQVAGERSPSRSCIFLMCQFPHRHQQPKVFFHEQTPLHAHELLVPSITWTATFSEEFSSSSQQSRREKKHKPVSHCKMSF